MNPQQRAFAHNFKGFLISFRQFIPVCTYNFCLPHFPTSIFGEKYISNLRTLCHFVIHQTKRPDLLDFTSVRLQTMLCAIVWKNF
jgi:hypothetical protein